MGTLMEESDGRYLTDRDYQSIPVRELSQRKYVQKPLVSVLMLAWNHESTIEQAIESIINQKCDFHFELLIGEDCSSDATLSICKRFVERNSGQVRLFTSEGNVGMHRNFARLWHQARGKYIAFCEGDDFWTDEKKIHKQVAWLEEHPEYTLCGAHTRKIRRDDRGSWSPCGKVAPPKHLESYGIRDLIPYYHFHFSSVMIKKEVVELPRWLWEVYCVDRPLYLFCAEKGPVGCLPECMSVYRLHDGGIWSPRREMDKARKGIALFKYIDQHFHHRHHRLIRKTVSQITWFYATECLFAGDYGTGRRLLRMSMGYAFPGLPVSLAIFIKSFFRLYFPVLYSRFKS